MNVLILTGAGISAESGIPTFRGPDGLWEGHRVEEVATPEAFARNPELVQKFYNLRRRNLLSPQIRPNAAHDSLAAFEQAHQGDFLLVTQNVDDLHKRAGSKKVIAMHGELLKARDMDTEEIFDWRDDLTSESVHPKIPGRLGRLRPHIVWFGEMPMGMEQIEAAAIKADVFIAIGTSGRVYPAAGIVELTPANCRRIEINLDETPASPRFNESHRGAATELVPQILQSLR